MLYKNLYLIKNQLMLVRRIINITKLRTIMLASFAENDPFDKFKKKGDDPKKNTKDNINTAEKTNPNDKTNKSHMKIKTTNFQTPLQSDNVAQAQNKKSSQSAKKSPSKDKSNAFSKFKPKQKTQENQFHEQKQSNQQQKSAPINEFKKQDRPSESKQQEKIQNSAFKKFASKQKAEQKEKVEQKQRFQQQVYKKKEQKIQNSAFKKFASKNNVESKQKVESKQTFAQQTSQQKQEQQIHKKQNKSQGKSSSASSSFSKFYQKEKKQSDSLFSNSSFGKFQKKTNKKAQAENKQQESANMWSNFKQKTQSISNKFQSQQEKWRFFEEIYEERKATFKVLRQTGRQLQKQMNSKQMGQVIERLSTELENSNPLKKWNIQYTMMRLILFGLFVAWLFNGVNFNDLFSASLTRESSQFFVESLRNQKIQETWFQTKKLPANTDEHEGSNFEKYVCIRLTDGSTYECVSNDEFQLFWSKQILSHNFQAATLGLKKPIILKQNRARSQFNVLDSARTVLTILFLIMIFRSVSAQMKSMSGKNAGNLSQLMGQSKSHRFRQNVNVKFADVVGMQKAKEQIVEFIDFLMTPEKYHKLGARIPRGALLTGPPGTGKTMIAKACAGESNVPFFTISGSQFIEMYVGVGAQRVRSLFQEAKKAAPSIIFIDEIDAVGKKRSGGMGGGNDQRDTTLNQLLVEMDGFNTNSNVIVFAATNQKDILDPALTRPGRFDRLIQVDLPDLEGRRQIFLVHLKPIVLDDKIPMDEYARRMATLTPGFSGADIKNLCNEAAIIAARHNRLFASLNDFQMATERIIGGVERKSTLITPETRKTVAYHECGHGVASWFIQNANPLLKLTIIPRSKGALGFAQYLPNQNQMYTKAKLMDQICVILGGRISEEIFFKKISTGASDDLKKAYDVAKAIVANYGFSSKMGWLSYQETEYAKEYSKATQNEIDAQILKIIQQCTLKTRAILGSHKEKLQKLAQILLQKQTIDQTIIQDTLGARPFKLTKQHEEYIKQKKKMVAENESKIAEENKLNQESNSFITKATQHFDVQSNAKSKIKYL